MTDHIAPPSWTEWARTPAEKTPQRKAFDEILGSLRKEGLIEVKSSLFVHLARYSFLQVRNARIQVQAFIRSIPDSVFGQISPTFRQAEVDSVLRILSGSGLCVITLQDATGITEVLLTEKQTEGEAARSQVVYGIQAHLREVYAKWDPPNLVLRVSSFPTPESVSSATRVDRAQLVGGDRCVVLQDKPDANETNETPFLQETIDKVPGVPLMMLQFWPLPDPKAGPPGIDPEFTILAPGEIPLATLVREHCVPVLGHYFLAGENYDLASEIQAKYSSYMHKYREKFSSSSTTFTDRIDKVLTNTDPDGELFASAVYVLAQVLRNAFRDTSSNLRSSHNPVVYQAARICYAHFMAQRVKKRQLERAAAGRSQDVALLVARLRDSPQPLTLEELKRTPDATKKTEIGAKHASLIELLPLVPAREGFRPQIYEVAGAYLHRENLIRAFLETRAREAIDQRQRLALEWAHSGIPSLDAVVISDRDVGSDFLKLFEHLHQERVIAPNTADFLRDFLASDRDLLVLSRWVWPDGHRGPITPLEVVVKGLDPILYEDRDRLRRRSLTGVLGIPQAYAVIVKSSWEIVLKEDGLFRYLLRRLTALFGGGGKPKTREQPAARSKKPSSVSAPPKSHEGAREADYRKLVALVPALKDRDSLSQDREKSAAQWCFKLDAEAGRKTRQAVDDEVGRFAIRMKPELLTEENSAKVAIYLKEKSPLLAQMTSSKAYHRYLYLTAVTKMAQFLGH